MTAAVTRPVRLQLSRRKGFNLQAHSSAVNGLSAVRCARPSRWGNPVTKQSIDDAVAAGLKVPANWRALAVKCFDAWLGGELPEFGEPPTIVDIQKGLAGKNLACWCPPGEPCHCDVLLELANS